MRLAILKHWAPPALLGVGVVGALVWLAHSFVHVAEPPATSSRPTARPPAVTLVPGARNDDLFKIEPLFLPTRYNTSVLKLPPHARQEPGSMSFTYAAKLTVSESGGGLALPEAFTVPQKPVDVPAIGEPPNPWPEIGRADVVLPVFQARAAFIEVLNARSGQRVFSEDVPVSPDLAGLPADWVPLEFLVAVDPAGLVGAPVSTRSTTSDEVESLFRLFLATRFHLGARLSPGFYTVRLGP